MNSIWKNGKIGGIVIKSSGRNSFAHGMTNTNSGSLPVISVSVQTLQQALWNLNSLSGSLLNLFQTRFDIKFKKKELVF